MVFTHIRNPLLIHEHIQILIVDCTSPSLVPTGMTGGSVNKIHVSQYLGNETFERHSCVTYYTFMAEDKNHYFDCFKC